MPKGKREYSRPSAGGIVRNDYHRRNRREHISMFCRSHGRNLPAASLSDYLPRFNLDALIKSAVAEASKRLGLPRELVQVKKACVDYLRHQCAPYEEQLRAGRKTRHGSQTAEWLSVSEHIFKEIAEVYPWLRDECERQLAYRRLTAARTKLVKKDDWKQRSLDRFNNERGVSRIERNEIAAEELTDAEYSAALCALKFQVTIYSPPFLNRDEIKARRFTDQYGEMNDRWWEWEREKRAKEEKFRWVA